MAGFTNNGERKVDELKVNGLLGVNNSLAYKVHEIEKHLHNAERWIGEPETRNAEITCFSVATVKPFQTNAGDGTAGGASQPWTEGYGTPLCVVGTGYTSVSYVAGVKFDLHRLQIHTTQSTTDKKIQRIQLIWGTGTVGDAITANQISEVMSDPDDGGGKNAPIPIMMPRLTIGIDKIWARHWVDNVNTGTLDFFLGLHEYVG
jgi:hypothetical protein